MGVLVVLLLAVTVLAVTAAWLLPADTSRLAAGVVAAGLAGVGLLAVLHGAVEEPGSQTAGWMLVSFALVAVVGGGPVTGGVLWLVDRGDDAAPAPGDEPAAGEVLQGGAWIGVLERAAVFATLVAGWPEGLAVVLALKGLGRYSELRADATADNGVGVVAERFIIGSFSSLLWGCACAGAFETLVG